VVRPCAGGDLPELGWGGKLRGLEWGFYRREREDGGLSTSRWVGRDQGAKPGARLPRCGRRGSPWHQQRPQQKNATAWRLPEGEERDFVGQRGFSKCWQVHMAKRAQLHGGASAS
jgi:hypothetical protein